MRTVLRRGSKKELSRRHLEGRNTPFREYDPLRVRPPRASPYLTQWKPVPTNRGLKGGKTLRTRSTTTRPKGQKFATSGVASPLAFF